MITEPLIKSDVAYGEAPASWNTSYITQDGFVCRITLRGETGKDLLDKASVALSYLMEHGYQPERNTHRRDTKPCPIHHCQMKSYAKDGKSWFSISSKMARGAMAAERSRRKEWTITLFTLTIRPACIGISYQSRQAECISVKVMFTMTSTNICCAWIATNISPKLRSALAGTGIQLRRIAMLTSSSNEVVPVMDHSEAGHRKAKPKRDKVEQTLSQIRALHEVLNSQLYAYPTERPEINSPADAANLLTPFIGNLDHEELWVANLDTRNRVKSLVVVYKGSVNSSQVRVGEVFRQAVAENAPAILIFHNHPSSDPTQSPDDVAVTRAIVQAGKLLDIDVLDHIIVCKEKFVSLKERGLGFS